MPANTISITRPGRFGNPFKIGSWYKKSVLGGIVGYSEFKGKNLAGFTKIKDAARAAEWFEWYVKKVANQPELIKLKDELRGKDLACWCKEGEPCHGDVWLKIANESKD